MTDTWLWETTERRLRESSAIIEREMVDVTKPPVGVVVIPFVPHTEGMNLLHEDFTCDRCREWVPPKDPGVHRLYMFRREFTFSGVNVCVMGGLCKDCALIVQAEEVAAGRPVEIRTDDVSRET